MRLFAMLQISLDDVAKITAAPVALSLLLLGIVLALLYGLRMLVLHQKACSDAAQKVAKTLETLNGTLSTQTEILRRVEAQSKAAEDLAHGIAERVARLEGPAR